MKIRGLLRGGPAWLIALLIAVLAVACAVRVTLARTHFPHIDDIGVATAILAARAAPPTADDLLRVALDKQRDGSDSARVALLLDLERRGLWRPLHAAGVAAYPYIVVPLNFTYAPLQFLLTGALLRPGQDYERVKLLGRLPSVMFSLLSVILVALCARRMAAAGAAALAVMAASGIAFSGEHTVLAAQMHSYAASSAASAAVLLLVVMDARGVSWSPRFVIGRAAALIGLCYLSYQVVTLVPGYCAALGIGALTRAERRDRPGIAVRGAMLGAIVALGFLPAYMFRVAGINSITFSAGPSREFVFERGLADAPRFFLTNAWVVLKALISPLPDDWGAASVVAALAAVALVAGWWVMLSRAAARHRWGPAAAAGVYTLTSVLVAGGLVLTRAIALGPTRHMIVYLPIVVIPAAYGLRAIAILAARRWLVGPRRSWTALSCAATLALMAMYVGHAGALLAERRDPFDERQLARLAREYAVDLIVADEAAHVLAMPALAREAPLDTTLPIVAMTAPRVSGGAPVPARTLVVSQLEPFGDDACSRLRDVIVRRAGVAPWEPCASRVRVLQTASRRSGVEVEFSRRTTNGTNEYHVAVVAVDPRP